MTTYTTVSRPSGMRALVLRWLISSLAIFAAVYIVPGITYDGPGWGIGLVALLFGLVNALLRPILTLLTCPLVLLTLGLFTFVINALLLLATERIAQTFGINFLIDSFWAAFFGGLVVSLVSTLLSWLAGDTFVATQPAPTDQTQRK